MYSPDSVPVLLSSRDRTHLGVQGFRPGAPSSIDRGLIKDSYFRETSTLKRRTVRSETVTR